MSMWVVGGGGPRIEKYRSISQGGGGAVANDATTSSEPTRPDAVRPPTLDDAADVLQRAIPRVTALVRDVPSGAQRVPHLEWTIAETAAHLWTGVTVFTGLLEGRSHPFRDIDSRAETN